MKPKKRQTEEDIALPFNMDARKIYRAVMMKYFRYAVALRGTAAKTPEAFFGFTCNEVETVHLHKQGAGEGMWFRLKDGRVFDDQARPDETDAAFYDATTH